MATRHIIFGFLAALLCGAAQADGNIPERFTIAPDPEFRSLDERMKSLNKDLLDLQQDLMRLQDDLLSPATTKVNVFFSLDNKDSAALDSVKLQLDNRPVTNYLYSAREIDALRRGGVQRLYDGNLAVGPHKLTVTVIAKDGEHSFTSDFEKDLTAKYLEIKLNTADKERPMVIKEYSARPAMAARKPLRITCIAAALLAAAHAGAGPAPGGERARAIAELELGPVNYQLLQGHYCSALDELRRARRLPELVPRDGDTSQGLAELYISLGLADQASELLRTLSGKNVPVPQHLWLNLARQYFQRGDLVSAEAALANLSDLPPGPVQAERDYLLSVVLLARKRNLEVIPISQTLQGQDAWSGFGRYNLGIALLETRRTEEGLALLERLGQNPELTDAAPGLRDSVNLKLGYYLLKQNELDRARAALARASGAKAALGAGWADYLRGDYRAAAQNWTSLTQGDSRDAAVQEGLLGLARAHYQLQDYPAAAAAHEKALRTFQSERQRLAQAAAAAADGSYLTTLLNASPGDEQAGWTWRPQGLADHPAGAYLAELTSGHTFQAAFKNYRNLLYWQKSLRTNGEDIDAYLSLFEAQRAHYWRILPKIAEYSKSLDRSGVFAEGLALKEALKRAETIGDVAALASAKEQRQLGILRRFAQQLDRNKDILVEHEELKDKYHLLHGLLFNDLSKAYPIRLWETKKAFIELDGLMSETVRAQKELHQAAERAKDNFADQGNGLKKLREQQRRLLAQSEELAARHREYLNALLARTLQEHERRLTRYVTQARLGLAQSYDRLASGGEKKTTDYGQAIAAYRAFIDDEQSVPQRRQALQRLAHLEMLQAENRYNQLMAKADKNAEVTTNAVDQIYRDATAALTRLLDTYPGQADNDRVLYQLANIYYNTGETDALLDTLERLVHGFPTSPYIDEAQFRRGELLFALGLPQQAAQAYGAVVVMGPDSPYYEKALYKHGWSLYKENHYTPALESFLSLLEDKLSGEAAPSAKDAAAGRGDEEMINDVLRVVSLSLSQLNGAQSIERYFKRVGPRPYEHRLYASLAELYLTQERIEDAAGTYRAFVERHPDDPRAPLFQVHALNAYEKGGFAAPLLASKEDFVKRYQPDSTFWTHNPGLEREETLGRVRGYLQDLAHYRHARAQSAKQDEDYRAAEHWYRLFVTSFPADPQAAEMNFLLAESLFEAQRYDEAIHEYERVAYDYPAHPKRAEAAYAAILTHEKLETLLSGAAQDAAQRRTIAALLRFAQQFPADPRALAAQTKAAQILFTRQDLAGAEQVARDILARTPPAGADYRLSAWRIIAHSEFETQRYAAAETSYQELLALTAKDGKERHDLTERLAAAIYKQGELAAANGDHRGAAQHFLRVGRLAPGAEIHPSAEYDAAAQLLSVQDWPAAIAVLERFRKDFPAHPLQKDLTAKLAVAYQNNRDWGKAAGELEKLAAQGENAELKRDALWQSAELYVRAERPQDAIRGFEQYLRQYPEPLTDAVEAHQRIADLYAQRGDEKNQQQWLTRLVAAEQKGGAARNERTRFLAANAALALAARRYAGFEQIKLSRPLEKSLKVKKQAMEDTLQAYRGAAEYGVAAVTTAATYHTARIYAEFGAALLDSERPKGLNEIELEQYNVLLEEQAYPFEEQAISLYEANAQRSAERIYDEWVQKSFAALSKLLPARYSKVEQGEQVIDTLY